MAIKMKKIEKEAKWLKNYSKIWIENIRTRGKKIYFIGTPVHGNLGDQAIALGVYKFLEDIHYDAAVIEIPSIYISKHTKLFQMIIGKSDILVHGGGFLGTIWQQEEEMVRKVIGVFKKNRISILPQTMYFEKNENGDKEKEISKQVYNSHKNISFYLREQDSYQLARSIIDSERVYLVPDMALLLEPVKNGSRRRENVLFCMRSDKEKALQAAEEEQLIKAVKKYFASEDICYTDTVIPENVWRNERKNAVYGKIGEFSRAKLVVTDRLHGMVFAALAGTPCIACGNMNYKVKGIYQWIQNNSHIVFVENFAQIDRIVQEISLLQGDMVFDKSLITDKYIPLEEELLRKQHS